MQANHLKPTLAASTESRLNLNPDEPEPPFLKRSKRLKSFDDGQPAAYAGTLTAPKGVTLAEALTAAG